MEALTWQCVRCAHFTPTHGNLSYATKNDRQNCDGMCVFHCILWNLSIATTIQGRSITFWTEVCPHEWECCVRRFIRMHASWIWWGPLHTRDWEPVTITLQASTFIGGKRRAGPISLHTMLEGPTEYVNARWMDVESTWIPTWIQMDRVLWSLGLRIFKNHLLEVGLSKGHFTHDPRVVTMKLWEPKR